MTAEAGAVEEGVEGDTLRFQPPTTRRDPLPRCVSRQPGRPATRPPVVAVLVRGSPYHAAMSINSVRSLLYRVARVLGDVNAVQKGRAGRRIGRRVVGRASGRGLGRLFK